MIIYIDSNFCCHAEPKIEYRTFDVPFFDEKCDEFINGYRYVPEGETWTRDDGVQFIGEMITPARNYAPLESAQKQYEIDEEKHLVEMAELIDEMESLCEELIGE